MGDVFDLSKLLAQTPLQDDRPLRDLSGKPKPENVRVQLNSGIELQCELKYDGIDEEGGRRYYIIAEIDWENYWPTTLIVGLYPTDVTLLFKMSDDMTDTEGWARAGSMRSIVEKHISVPKG